MPSSNESLQSYYNKLYVMKFRNKMVGNSNVVGTELYKVNTQNQKVLSSDESWNEWSLFDDRISVHFVVQRSFLIWETFYLVFGP